MAIEWNYNSEDYEEKDYSPIPVGDHRVRIASVAEKKFSSGNEGFEIVLDVSDYNSSLWLYMVLMPDNEKLTNQKLGAFFDSFGINDHNLNNYKQWVGKTGGVRVKHEEYNGDMTAKVHYCLSKKKQETLPQWKEMRTEKLTNNATAPNMSGFTEMTDNDFPL